SWWPLRGSNGSMHYRPLPAPSEQAECTEAASEAGKQQKSEFRGPELKSFGGLSGTGTSKLRRPSAQYSHSAPTPTEERPSAPIPPCTFRRRVTSMVAVAAESSGLAPARTPTLIRLPMYRDAPTVGPPCAPVLMSTLSTPSARRVRSKTSDPPSPESCATAWAS